MTLLKYLKKEQNYTLTENGALAPNSTSNALTDLFSVAGALRGAKEDRIIEKFAKAMAEDHLLAVKLAFYTRDVRGGLGERRTGRLMFRYLARYYPDIFARNIRYIAEYGRYDDLIDLLYEAPDLITELIADQLKDDIGNMKEGRPVSLLAKWMPSINTSDRKRVLKGRYLAKKLGMSEKEYRRTLSSLRKYLNVCEVRMSAKEYAPIVYQEVPSKAMNIYRNAFRRNDPERFGEYLSGLANGETKVNASVLYPCDIVEKYLYQGNGKDVLLEEQWKALPDYVEGENSFLVMADVSGSMSGRPMATSVGLAMYFAERNKGPFANTFMTFSARPELVTIKGKDLFEKIDFIRNASWSMNTDRKAAFELVLHTAVKYHVSRDEMPSSIVVITDMEIDFCGTRDWTFYDLMQARFRQHGYEIPNLVFWNVNSRKDTYMASFDRKGVQLASGQSASVFASLVKGLNMTPYDYMLSVLNDERYDRIQV